MAKKKKAYKKLGGAKKKDVKYFVRGDADRNFKKDVDGFDLVLGINEEKEVTKEVADLVKEKFSYLSVEER